MLLLATPCAVHHRYGRIYTYRQYLGRRVYSVTLQFSKAEAEGKRKGKVHKSHVTNLAAPFNEAVGSITIPSTATTAKYNCKIQLQTHLLKLSSYGPKGGKAALWSTETRPFGWSQWSYLRICLYHGVRWNRCLRGILRCWRHSRSLCLSSTGN